MITLYRTFAGNTSHYSPDGNGRDSYIIQNNGGICRTACTTVTKSGSPSPRRDYSPPKPKLDAKVFRYNSNGSGRDTYISWNGGGMYSSYGSKPFHMSLREHSPSQTIESSDIFFKTQTQWLRQKRNRRSSLDDVTKRLSVPKYKKEKYAETVRKASPDVKKETNMLRSTYY
ncbi:unnamed protein product [Blepharisma stoltei]|uniref:Uncharacterized protein n=1 Tax=Blepharisma stoltei TaxID=1481888 RepID=A0AAU9IT72_9CILI|nr:unnamed protein product [Blepharisma stoltei]